jgi:hypothetical protein
LRGRVPIIIFQKRLSTTIITPLPPQSDPLKTSLPMLDPMIVIPLIISLMNILLELIVIGPPNHPEED